MTPTRLKTLALRALLLVLGTASALPGQTGSAPEVTWETYLGSRGGSSVDTITAVHERVVEPLPGHAPSEMDRIVTVVGTTRREWWHRPGGTTFGAYHPSPGLPAIFVAVFDRRITSGIAPPTTPCVGPNSTGCFDQLVYAVVLGSNGADHPRGMHVDENGVITIVGWTSSPEFPTTPDAYDRAHGGGREGFLLRLEPDTVDPGPDDLRYATFLGGTGDDEVRDVEVRDSIAYAVCSSNSRDWLVTPNAYSASPAGGFDVVCVALDLNQVGPAQGMYVSYLGSARDDEPRALALEGASPCMLVAGTTYDDGRAPTWPVVPVEPLGNGAFGPNTCFMPVDRAGAEGFFARIDPHAAGNASLLYSTYVGGDGDDAVNDVVALANGHVVLVGETTSSDFPDGLRYDQPGQASLSQAIGGVDGFALELTGAMRDGSPQAPQGGREAQVPYVTYLGTLGDDAVAQVSPYGATSWLLAGITQPTRPDEFPTTAGALQEEALGGREAFLAVLEPDLALDPPSGQIAYATLLGGEREEIAVAMHYVDGDAAPLLALETLSTFPVTTACVFLPTRCETLAPDLYLARTSLPTFTLGALPASVRIGERLMITWQGDLNAIGATVAIEWSVDEQSWFALASGMPNQGMGEVTIPCPPMEGASVSGVVLRVRSESQPSYRVRSGRITIEPIVSPMLLDRAQVKTSTRPSSDAVSLRALLDPAFDETRLRSGVDGLEFLDPNGTSTVASYTFTWTSIDERRAQGTVQDAGVPSIDVGRVKLDLRKGRCDVRLKRIDLAATMPQPVVRLHLGAFETQQALPFYETRGSGTRSSYRRGTSAVPTFAPEHVFVDKAKFRAGRSGGLQFDVEGTLVLPRATGCPATWQSPPHVMVRAQDTLATLLMRSCDGTTCTLLGSLGAGTFTLELDAVTGAFRWRGEEPTLAMRPAAGNAVSFQIDLLVEELAFRTTLVMPDGAGKWTYPSR